MQNAKLDLSNYIISDIYAWDPQDPKSSELMESNKHITLFRYLNNTEVDTSDLSIYKKSLHDNKFYHISLFKVTKRPNRLRATVDGTIKEVSSKIKRIQIYNRYSDNMCNIIAMIQYGNPVKSLKEMKCLSGIDDIGWPVRDPETNEVFMVKMGLTLHHILYIDSTSEHKENSSVGPSQLLRTLDLTKPDSGRYEENNKAIHEFLSCVIINAGHHNQLHREWKSGGYEHMHGLNIIPFFLQSEENYNKVLSFLNEKYGYEISMTYSQRIKSLSLNP